MAKVGDAIPMMSRLPTQFHNILKHSTNGMKDGQVRVIPGLVEGDKVAWTSVVKLPQIKPENVPIGEESYQKSENVRKSVANALVSNKKNFKP